VDSGAFVFIDPGVPCASARIDIHRVFLAGQSPVAQINDQSPSSSQYDTDGQIPHGVNRPGLLVYRIYVSQRRKERKELLPSVVCMKRSVIRETLKPKKFPVIPDSVFVDPESMFFNS
jgi:hypothetical protein